jgi:hypothetical protein
MCVSSCMSFVLTDSIGEYLSNEKGDRTKNKGRRWPTLPCNEPVTQSRYFMCFESNLVISNIETFFLPPKTRCSLSSALIIRRFIVSCNLFFLM